MLTISDLISELDILLRVDDDLLLTIDGDDLRRAIRVARMIDESTITTIDSDSVVRAQIEQTYPRLPFLVASTTKSSSIRNR